jgi:hypothetical protein
MNKQTATRYLKENGIESVQILADFTELKPRRLFDWWNNENKAFKVLVAGYLEMNK